MMTHVPNADCFGFHHSQGTHEAGRHLVAKDNDKAMFIEYAFRISSLAEQYRAVQSAVADRIAIEAR